MSSWRWRLVADEVLNGGDMVFEFFGVREGLAHQPVDALTQGVVEALVSSAWRTGAGPLG